MNYLKKIIFLAVVIIANAISMAQTIKIDYVPPIGQGGLAEGRVIWEELTAANAENYAMIAILCATWGDDYVKPSWDNYLCQVDEDGFFFINITTNPDDYFQPKYNFYFVERETFNGVDGSTIKSWYMTGKYLGDFISIDRNEFWAAKLPSPIPNIRPGFVPAKTSITLNQPEISDAVILFTLDGSNPVISTTAQTYSGQIFSVPSTGVMLVKAVTTKDGNYSYPSNMIWLAQETLNTDCKLFGLNVSLALNGEVFGFQLSRETTQERMKPLSHLTHWIRTFGTLNNGLEYVNDIAKQMNLKTMIGVYISNDIENNNKQLQGLKNILETSTIDLLVVGNECNNSSLVTYVAPKILSNYIDSVRNILQNKGLLIPIGTVDIGSTAYCQMILQKIDFRGVNLYPGTYDATPENQMFEQLKTSWQEELLRTPSMMVCLTETGTPYSGGTSVGGIQIASEEKASKYLKNVLTWVHQDTIPCFYFEAYDEQAKGDGIAQHFGLMNGNLEVHPFYKDILCNIPTHIIETKNSYKLFPNPVTNMLKIVRSTSDNAQVEIYNSMGALVQSFEMNGAEAEVNVERLPVGVYLVRVVGRDAINSVSTARFIKN